MVDSQWLTDVPFWMLVLIEVVYDEDLVIRTAGHSGESPDCGGDFILLGA